MYLKKITVFIVALVLAVFCFYAFRSNINSNYSNKSLTDSSIKIKPDSSINSTFSDELYSIERKILFQKTDSSKIESLIKNLTSEFEVDYLHAIHNIKLRNYSTVFKYLIDHLINLPPHFNYYDNLVFAAKATDNLFTLEEKIKNLTDNKSAYNNYALAIVYFAKGNYEGSIQQLNKNIDSTNASKEIFYLLAANYRGLGDYEKGLQALLKAEELCDSNDIFLPKIYNSMGTFYYLSSYYNKALEVYSKSLALAEQNGNTIEHIKALGNLAIIDDIYGEVENARLKLTNAINKAEEIQNTELLAFLFSELGVSLTYTNNIVEARKNYKKSFDLYEEINNAERLSYLSSNIGSIYLQQNNYDAALKSYEGGLKLARNNVLAQTLNLIGIADVYSNISNYSRALEYYNKANALADSVKDVSSLIKIDEGIGALFFNTNRPDNALEILLEAEKKISQDFLPFEAAGLYHKIGVVLTSINKLESAEEYLRRGIEITERTEDIYNNIVLKTELAHVFINSDKLTEAFQLLSKVYKQSQEYELIQLMALQNLYFGEYHLAKGENEKAEEKLKKSIDYSKEADDSNTLIESGFLLAKIFERTGKSKLAEEWFTKTINEIETVSTSLYSNQQVQISHFGGVQEIYNAFIDFQLKENRITEAFELLERSRSRNTLQNVYQLKLISELGDESEIEKFIDLKWMIDSDLYNGKTLDSLNIIFSRLENELENKVSEDLQINPWLSHQQLKNQLNENENIISLFVNDNYIQVFNLSSDNLTVNKIEISRDNLLKLIKEISPALKSDKYNPEIFSNQDLFSFDALASNKFYNVIFKEIVEEIPSGEQIIFNLPTELLSIPVELLVIEYGKNNSPYYYDDKVFMISRNPVSYTPSASIYVSLKKRTESKYSQNLFIGDPEISNQDFVMSYRSGLLSGSNLQSRNIELYPLFYSKYEVESVYNILAGGKLLLSEEATETNFKHDSQQSNIIHISTHSFLYKEQPLIILSHNAKELNDGYLEAEEIVKLKLNSDLVVLSSCRSGLGKIDEAEGVIGMQKAFFEAGANSIVVSLWDVSDKYTSVFMELFYSNLAKGISKPESLQKAKLTFMKDYSANPYFWSAFVLAGNSASLNLESSNKTTSTFLYVFAGLLIFSILIRIFRTRRSK